MLGFSELSEVGVEYYGRGYEEGYEEGYRDAKDGEVKEDEKEIEVGSFWEGRFDPLFVAKVLSITEGDVAVEITHSESEVRSTHSYTKQYLLFAYTLRQGTPEDEKTRLHPHYFKSVEHLDVVDVYMVCKIFGIDDCSGATHHSLKKLLLSGKRGVKSKLKDIKEARDTLNRLIEIEEMSPTESE